MASVQLPSPGRTCQSTPSRRLAKDSGDILKFLAGAACAIAFGAAASVPLQASAMVLIDNGPGLPGVGGPDITRNVSADDFLIAQSSTVRGGSFYYTVPGDFMPPTPVSYFIYSSIYKNEYQQPGVLLSSGTLTITEITPVSYSGLPYATRYLANFTLETPFAAKGGDLYWFALTSKAPEQILWTTSNFRTPTATWNHHNSDAPGQWWRSDYERAFTLTGSVPEPATWAMMIVGFGAVGSAVRGRRRQMAISA